MRDGWIRTTKSKPCPVCKRPNAEHESSWCMYSKDGTVAICPFTESAKRTKQGHYLHRLKEQTEGAAHRYGREQDVPKVVAWATLNRIYQSGLNGQLEIHAKKLGVSEASLLRLGVGWDAEALTFPMTDCGGRILGIRRRFADGRKRSVTGGREGLFIPTGQSAWGGLIFVCEGPTDLCAMLDWGFCAIGRPSCLGAEDFTIKYVGKRECFVMADNDGPGLGGAKSLARKMKNVRIVSPPDNIKDARAWLISGATMDDVLARCGLDEDG